MRRRRFGRIRGRVGGPNPRHMTPGQINKEMEQLAKMRREWVDEMISSGRGSEKAWETLKKSPSEDSLTLMGHALWHRQADLQAEKERRMGQKWYGDLPKDAKPIRGW